MIGLTRSYLHRRAALPLSAFVLQLCFLSFAQAGTTLVFATVDEDAKQESREFGPIADYLRLHLRSAGVDDVRVVAHTTVDGVAEGIITGDVDIYIDSIVLAALVGRKSGAKPFLRAWKEGVAEYHTVIYAREDAGLGSLDDLRGKVLAFKAPESTPGHLVPRALLLSRGYRLVELKRPGDPVPPDAIGYVFAHGDRTAFAWVMKGVVEAAVVKDDFYEREIAPDARDGLTVLGRTPPVPRQVLMHRLELDPGLRVALEAVLLDMHRDDEGRRALEIMHGTARFDRFPGGADAAFERIHAMLDLLDRERSEGLGSGPVN